MCYMKLSQTNAAEEAFSQSLVLEMYKTMFPRGHDNITHSETTRVVRHQLLLTVVSSVEQAVHEIWQLKFGRVK